MARKAVRAAAMAAVLFAGAAAGTQVPLVDSAGAGLVSEAHPGRTTPATRLNFSSPAPHLFASAYGLLQQWSNTVFPNGHALAGCTVPAYTLLYHGRQEEDDAGTPASPEWLALDLEMAYGIMGASRHSWLLTYQTTRPLRLLYFDGESATLMGLGQLDAQMLLLYGNVTGPPAVPGSGFAVMGDEYARARGLCDWLARAGLRGRGWGYEGVVRMNAGFEIIWCDFLSDSLRLLSRLNVTAPLDRVEAPFVTAAGSYYSLPPVPTRTDRVTDPSAPPSPPNWRGPGSSGGREPFLEAQGWGWFESATWHYGSSRAGAGAGGETRVRVDSCAIFSFYAPQFDGGPLALARAQDERRALNLTADGCWDGEGEGGDRTRALGQLARRRRYHHLGDTSEDEAVAMRQRVERSLAGLFNETTAVHAARRQPVCSGADWTLMLAEIVQRVAVHLKTMEKLLGDGPVGGPAAAANATRAWLHQLRAQSHMFMVGYLEYPTQAGSAATSAWQPHSALFNRTLALCRYRYTRLLVPDDEDGTGSSSSSSSPSSVRLSPEEADMRWAVEETYGTLCTELLTIGFDVEREWAERYGSVGDGRVEDADADADADVGRDRDTTDMPRSRWRDRLAELMAWLGWEGEFIGCPRVCDWDERCFIPMWPMLSSQWGRNGPGGHGGPGGPGRGYGRPGGPGGGGGGGGGHDHRSPGGGPGGSPRWPPSQNGSYGPPGFGFPRTPAMMGNETDLWEPKCIKAWYVNG